MFTKQEYYLLMEILNTEKSMIETRLNVGMYDRNERDQKRHEFIRICQIMRKVQAIQGTATETTLAAISDKMDLGAMFENMKAISAAQQEKEV